jgi:hypothetical protein
VIPDTVGFVIYRVDSKRQIPFDEAKEDVKRRITQQRIRDLQQQFSAAAAKVDYNSAYFGPESPAASGVPGTPEGARPAVRGSNMPAPSATPQPVTGSAQVPRTVPANPK